MGSLDEDIKLSQQMLQLDGLHKRRRRFLEKDARPNALFGDKFRVDTSRCLE